MTESMTFVAGTPMHTTSIFSAPHAILQSNIHLIHFWNGTTSDSESDDENDLNIVQFTTSVPECMYIHESRAHASASVYGTSVTDDTSLAKPRVDGVTLDLDGSYDMADDTGGCILLE
jgi:hypothetical protein